MKRRSCSVESPQTGLARRLRIHFRSRSGRLRPTRSVAGFTLAMAGVGLNKVTLLVPAGVCAGRADGCDRDGVGFRHGGRGSVESRRGNGSRRSAASGCTVDLPTHRLIRGTGYGRTEGLRGAGRHGGRAPARRKQLTAPVALGRRGIVCRAGQCTRTTHWKEDAKEQMPVQKPSQAMISWVGEVSRKESEYAGTDGSNNWPEVHIQSSENPEGARETHFGSRS